MRAETTIRGGESHKVFLQLLNSDSCKVIDENIRKKLIEEHFESIYKAFGQGYRAGRLAEIKEQTNADI